MALPEGICHLCGEHRPLSFEHVPPEAAFNDRSVLYTDIKRMLGADNLIDMLERPRGKTSQRGAGQNTLCEPCNNHTGHWYGGAYVEFVHAVFPVCQALSAGEPAFLTLECRPMNILKQMLVMFCSASPPKFALSHPSLVRFLLNKQSRDCEEFRLYASFYDLVNSRATRQAGVVGRISLDQDVPQVFSEISFPPFNLVMSLTGERPDKRLFDVSWFRQYRYSEVARISMTLTNLAVNTYFPGDYRTWDEIRNLGTEQKK